MSNPKQPDDPEMTWEELEQLLPELEIVEIEPTRAPDHVPLITPQQVIDLGWRRKQEIPKA